MFPSAKILAPRHKNSHSLLIGCFHSAVPLFILYNRYRSIVGLNLEKRLIKIKTDLFLSFVSSKADEINIDEIFPQGATEVFQETINRMRLENMQETVVKFKEGE